MSRVERHASPSAGWRTDEILLGVLQHAVGMALFLVGCVLILSSDQVRAAGSGFMVGLLISVLTRANQIHFRAGVERGIAVAGAWTVLAPWMLGFAANDVATWTHVTLGVVTLVSARAWLRVESEGKL